MSKWMVKSLDRSFAQQLLSAKAHHVQASLPWFDFLREYSAEDDRSVTLYCDSAPVGFFCALQHRNLIQSLPYPASYSGLQLTTRFNSVELEQAYATLFEHYAKYCDVLSICTSPLFDPDECDPLLFDYCRSNEAHVIDLANEPLSGTTSKFRNNLRRNLRKAEMAGVQVELASGTNNLAEWHDCYEKRMNELHGQHLPLAYFESLFSRLQASDNCSLITARVGKRFLGGIVTVQNRHCLDYYLSVFNRDDDEMQASTAAFSFLLHYTRRCGIKLLNLQSSPRSQTDLIHFKESWGAVPARHHYLVKVLNNKEQVLQLAAEEIKMKYRFHFLLPFTALASEPELV